MQITLKDIKAGKAIQLEVAADETIAAVKARVEAEHAIPAAQQRLIFCGKTVPDAQSLRDLGIQKDAMLHLVYKLASSQPVEIRARRARRSPSTCSPVTENAPESELASPNHTANLSGPLLGCIEAVFCKLHFRSL